MKVCAFAVSAMLAGGVCAAPEITDVRIDQADNRKVTVSYHLSEPAIVMAEFMSGGESVGDEALRDGLAGDVFTPVAAGDRSFTWRPRKSWPDHTSADFKVKLTPTAVSDPPEWMVVDLVKGGGARYYDRESLLIGGSHSNAAYKSTHLLLKRIPAAGIPWRMGSAEHAAEFPHCFLLTFIAPCIALTDSLQVGRIREKPLRIGKGGIYRVEIVQQNLSPSDERIKLLISAILTAPALMKGHQKYQFIGREAVSSSLDELTQGEYTWKDDGIPVGQ